MERSNILEGYETSPLNLTGTRCRGETIHVMLWMHGRAYLTEPILAELHRERLFIENGCKLNDRFQH